MITTDGEGIARLELPDDYHDLVVVSEAPFAAVGAGWGRGISPWDFGVGEGLYVPRTTRPTSTPTARSTARGRPSLQRRDPRR